MQGIKRLGPVRMFNWSIVDEDGQFVAPNYGFRLCGQVWGHPFSGDGDLRTTTEVGHANGYVVDTVWTTYWLCGGPSSAYAEAMQAAGCKFDATCPFSASLGASIWRWLASWRPSWI